MASDDALASLQLIKPRYRALSASLMASLSAPLIRLSDGLSECAPHQVMASLSAPLIASNDLSDCLSHRLSECGSLIVLQAEYTEVADEVIKKTLRVSDQRLYLRSIPSLTTSVVAKVVGSATDTKPPAGKEVSDGRTSPPPQAAQAGATVKAAVNALTMIDQLMAPSSDDHANLTNFFCRTKSKTVR